MSIINFANPYGMTSEDAAIFISVLNNSGHIDICQYHAGNALYRLREQHYDLLKGFHCVLEPDFDVLGLILYRITGHHIEFEPKRHGYYARLAKPKKLDVTSIIPPPSPSWFSCLLIALGLRKRASTLDYLEALDRWLDKKLASS